MGSIDILRISAIVLSLIVLIGGALMLFPGSADYLSEFVEQKDPEPIVFEDFVPDDREEQFLTCPADLCANAGAHRLTPVYSVSADNLRARLLELIDNDPRISLRTADVGIDQYEFLAISPRQRYPDQITIRILELAPDRSSAAIFSRSISESERGTRNADRINRWLQIIDDARNL